MIHLVFAILLVHWTQIDAARAQTESAEVAADAAVLRVGTSGDYAPFSVAADSVYQGFDIAVARAYAADRGLELRFVPFSWPDLAGSLSADRFDVDVIKKHFQNRLVASLRQ